MSARKTASPGSASWPYIGARLLSLVGLAAGAGYLAWRTGSSLRGVPGWLAAPTLAVEVGGFLAVAVLVWALWPQPVDGRPTAASPGFGPVDVEADVDVDVDVDIMVRYGGRGLAWLRATVMEARSLGRVTVVDLGNDQFVAALTGELGVDRVVAAADDLNGLAIAIAACRSPWMLLLDAGDIPARDIVDRLLPHLTRPDVAVVQGLGTSTLAESAQHESPGRHERDFEMRSLYPSLGRRGVAPFTGSGALVRVAALADIDVSTSSPAMAQAEITAELFAQGWQIVAPAGRPVLGFDSTLVESDAESMLACSASAARYLVFSVDGALRINRLSLTQRLALLACAVRPLAGLRRAVLVAAVASVLLSGRLPFATPPTVIVAVWAAWFAVPAVALELLSGGTLRHGDRARQPFRLLGASWRGVLAPNGRPEPRKLIVAGAFGVDHLVAPAAAISVISVVLALRGLSDRITHVLAPVPLDKLSYVLMVTLWLLWSALDALRMVVRRSQSRRVSRVGSVRSCTLADQHGVVVDITPLGAGVVTGLEVMDPAAIGEIVLQLAIPTASGDVTVSVPVTVRNTRLNANGHFRSGVSFESFESLEPEVADALAEYCIVQPARDVLAGGRLRAVSVVDARAERSSHFGLRSAALLAVTGAVASATSGAAPELGPVTWVLVCAAAVLGAEVVVGALTTTRRPRTDVDGRGGGQSVDLARLGDQVADRPFGSRVAMHE